MPIPLPNLDDRRWADLVEEGRALIPVFAPEWTDHNPSDPGITLLEVFAFITETLLYRANRIPDRQRRRMLALAGIRQRGPKAARVLLGFTSDQAGSVPAGTVCSGDNAAGERIQFRTMATVAVAPGALAFAGEPASNLTITFLEQVTAGATLSLGFIIRGDGTSFVERDRILEDEGPELRHHSVRLRWEYETAGGWLPIDEVEDRTRALTLDGVVTLTVPAATTSVRVSLIAGEYDRPPEIVSVFLNAAEAEQGVYNADQPVAIATGDGSPLQKIGLPGSPVIEESVVIETDEGVWERRDDLAASLPASRHYLLEPTRGEVTFGDGNHGQVPEPGEIRARYLSTRGSLGDVAARAIDGIDDPALETISVVNPAASEASADAETLAHAVGRARVLREASLRAVNLIDIETIAIETPGTEIARASARANMFPGLACVNALGVITVIILPASDAPRPTPSAGLLALVARRLEKRRIIGTRIVVTGPDYVEIAVHARVKALPGGRRDTIQARVLGALRVLFDPLIWPFGRDVYRSEVLQAIDEVEGVDFVDMLELAANRCEPRCGNICMPGTALVAEGAHQIEVIV